MKKTKGFTLIEILIAMVIIAITSIVTLEFYVFCQKNFIVKPQLRLMAVNFSRDSMEDYYFNSSLTAGASTPALPSTNTNIGDPLLDNYGGTETITITNKTNYKIIETLITWNS